MTVGCVSYNAIAIVVVVDDACQNCIFNMNTMNIITNSYSFLLWVV